VKSLFLSNATFAMEILDLISRVGALYEPLNVHMSSPSVHLAVMIAFKGTLNVKLSWKICEFYNPGYFRG
jgi:hypothetical protein